MSDLIVVVVNDEIPLAVEIGNYAPSRCDFCVPCSNESTAITAGAGKATFIMTHGMILMTIFVSLTVAQSSGSTFTVDVNKNGSSILSTKLTIDNTEKTSLTAAIQAVITDSMLSAHDEVSIDVDQVGDGTAKGIKVYFVGNTTA